MTTQADIIRKEPWFVLPIIRNWYFEKYTKSRSDVLDQNAGQFEGWYDTVWQEFQQNPKRLPVYTSEQFNAMIKDRELTDVDKRNLNLALQNNQKTALFAKSNVINLGGAFNFVAKVIAGMMTFISNVKNILAIEAQKVHEYIAENHWDKINPANAFWARLLKRFEWMQKKTQKKQDRLVGISPYYRAKIEGKLIEEIKQEYAEYFNKFDIEEEQEEQEEQEESEERDDEYGQFKPYSTTPKTSEEEKEQPTLSSSSYVDFLGANDNNNNIALTDPDAQPFPWNESKTSLAEHARQTLTKCNNKAKVQFARDVEYLQQAIVSPGSDTHHGSLAALILKKLFFTFDVLDPMYKRDGKWCRFSEADIPLASVLSHTGRLLIQLPPKNKDDNTGAEFFEKFLGVNTKHKRDAATHGIMLRPNNEMTCENVLKSVTETKPGKLESGADYLVNKVRSKLGAETKTGHYGINLALGGDRNEHFLSQKTINNKGENGHLYFYYLPATEKHPGAVLVGIEQSAPSDKAAVEVQSFLGSVYDNVGGGHDILGTPNHFSSTGGDHWGRAPEVKFEGSDEYIGLKNHGPDQYYDGIFSSLTKEQLAYIMESFNAEKFDLSLLGRPATFNKLPKNGHQALSENLEKQKIELTQDEWKLWNYFSKLVGKKKEEIDLEEYRGQILTLVTDKLRAYLVQDGKDEGNRNVIADLIKKLHAVKSWHDLFVVTHGIEQINIKENDEKKTVADILNKNELLPAYLLKKDESDSEETDGEHKLFIEGSISSTVLAPLEKVYEYIIPGVHSKDAIFDTHKALVDLALEFQKNNTAALKLSGSNKGLF